MTRFPKPIVVFSLAMLATIAGQVIAQVIEDFDGKTPWTVFKGEEIGAKAESQEGPAPHVKSLKVSWTKVPPRGLMDLTPDKRPELAELAAKQFQGTLKLTAFCEAADTVKGFEVRIKDKDGESYSWGVDVAMPAGQWQEVRIPISPETAQGYRADNPSKADKKITAPVVLAALKIRVHAKNQAGSVLIDDIAFDAVDATTRPTTAP